MIAGMGGRKAGAYGTVVDQDVDAISQIRVMTGTQTEDKAFYQIAADLISDGDRQDEHQHPPPTFPAKIKGNEYQEEEVNGHPEFHFPQEWEDKVGNRACPVLVDFREKPMIRLYDLLNEARMTVTVK